MIRMLKPILTLILTLSLTLTLAACQTQEAPSQEPEETESQVMTATLLEVTDQDQLLVEPVDGSSELNSADRIVAHARDALVLDASGEEVSLEDYEVGSLVQITYDGMIAESYPAQIWAQKIQLAQ